MRPENGMPSFSQAEMDREGADERMAVLTLHLQAQTRTSLSACDIQWKSGRTWPRSRRPAGQVLRRHPLRVCPTRDTLFSWVRPADVQYKLRGLTGVPCTVTR